MLTTPNLSGKFLPQPKPNRKSKKPKTPIGAGKATLHWEQGRQKLKADFRDHGIITCEIMLDICKRTFTWGFAHTKQRKYLTDEQIVDPHFVVMACNPCHDFVDFKMPKDEAEELLTNIVKARGW